MAKKGRPFVYQSEEEKPVTVSLRIPRDLAEQAKRYVSLRHSMTLTDLLLDGLRLRLDTPTDPRDLILSDDNTVIRELEEMVDAAVQRALAKERTARGALDSSVAASAPEVAVQPDADLSHNGNAVLQEEVPRSVGKRGAMRQRILTLLQDRPEGLSAEQIRAYLQPERPLGDTLQGMKVQGKVHTRKEGKALRYFVE